MPSHAAVNADMALETFELFPILPIELRLKIWGIAAYQPHDVHATIILVESKGGRKKPQFKSLTRVPAILHTNHEARTEALKFFTKCLPEMNCSQIFTFLRKNAENRMTRGMWSAMGILLQGDQTPTLGSLLQLPFQKPAQRIYINPVTDLLYFDIPKANRSMLSFLGCGNVAQQWREIKRQQGDQPDFDTLQQRGIFPIGISTCPVMGRIWHHVETSFRHGRGYHGTRCIYIMKMVEHSDVPNEEEEEEEDNDAGQLEQAVHRRCEIYFAVNAYGIFKVSEKLKTWDYMVQGLMVEFVLEEGYKRHYKWWRRGGRLLKFIFTLGRS